MSWPISTGKSGFPVITTQPNNIGLVICGWTTAAAVYSTNSHPPKPPPFQKTKQRAQKLLRTIKDLPVPKENIYTLPNLLTFTRLVASPFIGYLVVNHQYGPAILGCALFGLTDALDGFIARRFNMKSVVGSILDPAADKALMTVLTVSLAMSHLLPWWLASIILLRDGGLVLAAFYYRYISLPPPKTLSRYFDFSLPSAEVHPTTISKVNTMLQLGLMLASLGAPLLEITNTVPLTVLQYTVATTTILSGISYLRSKNAVRILTRPPLGPSKPPSP
ncbi:hypothetical protein IWQ62_000702 [Dispira parvispora]|uniref:Uncharacterized protein n=1 Tax=Dispira parvispora TaxID=1520584 RepID=A0A9W8B0Q3_9FUNG|nr:hypothetical protein IWQ62_000702 [Dispira parvispora]